MVSPTFISVLGFFPTPTAAALLEFPSFGRGSGFPSRPKGCFKDISWMCRCCCSKKVDFIPRGVVITGES